MYKNKIFFCKRMQQNTNMLDSKSVALGTESVALQPVETSHTKEVYLVFSILDTLA